VSVGDRIAARFEPHRQRHGEDLLALIISDYLVAYRRRGESCRRLALLFLPRLLSNPELHATLLLRLALSGPRVLLPFWRTVLIAKHAIDIMPEIEIGPGLRLPHPQNIVFGWAVSIGRNVTILHNVTLGGESHPRDFRTDITAQHIPAGVFRPCPRIEDDVVIYAGSMVFGPITLGRGAVVGAESWVNHDLEADSVHLGRQQ
jgi:serine O-acetyltransferase